MNAGLAKIIGWDSVGGDLNAGLASVDDDPGIDFVTNAGGTFFVTNDGVGFVNNAGEASAAEIGWSSMPSSAKSALRCALSVDKSGSMAGAGDGSGAFDGVSELWFDDQSAFEAAYATDHGRAVAADSMAHVSRRERLFVAEHVLVPHH